MQAINNTETCANSFQIYDAFMDPTSKSQTILMCRVIVHLGRIVPTPQSCLLFQSPSVPGPCALYIHVRM